MTPIIKSLYPQCLLCGAETQVGHHHVHKSKSMVLRHNVNNIIPLCNGCHFKLHFNESYWASVIVKKRGLSWFNKLEKEKNKIIKADRLYFENKLKELDKYETNNVEI